MPDARRGAGLKPAPTLFAAGARLSSHRRVCGLRANRLMVDKKGPVPPTSPDRRPSGRRNDVAARHHLVLQPRVSTVAVSARRSGGDLCGIEGAIVSDLERASPASGRFTKPPLRRVPFALRKGRDFPSGLHGGVSINTPHPDTAATSSLVTRFVVALRLTSIKHVTGTVAVRLEQSLSPFGLGSRFGLAMWTPVRRPLFISW